MAYKSVNGRLVKSNKSQANLGLLDFMFQLGDGQRANHMRNSILSQIIDQMNQNMPAILANAQRAKTTLAQGIQAGIPGTMIDIDDYHISVEDPLFRDAMAAFQALVRSSPDHRHLQIGYMFSKDINALAPFMAYMNPACNIVITKWQHGTIIRFFNDQGVDKQTATGDTETDAQMIADMVDRICG